MELCVLARTTSLALRLLGALLCLTAFLCAQTVRHHQVAVDDPSQPPELTQAENALEKQDYDTALPLLLKVTDRDPANYRAWFDLGFAYNAQNKPEDSIAAYLKSVKAKPDVFESNLNLGLMMMKYKQPGAEEYLRAATRLKPMNHPAEGQSQAWMALGHLLASSNAAEALNAFAQAEALRPADPEPHLASASLLAQQNKFADAEREYKDALALDPSSSSALSGLAGIYIRGARFSEAEEFLRKIAAQHPGDAAPHAQLGRVLAADNQFDAAIPELQLALKLAPGDRSIAHDLADAYSAGNHFDEAEKLYRALLEAQPRDPELHHGLAVALLKQKKFADAESEFLTTVKLKPDWGEAYGELAIAANENKHYTLVIAALDARTKLMPDIPATYFLRATAYDHLRDMKQAAANYHLFLQMADGKYPDQEWQARHRLIAIEPNKK
jgi:Flp pilus assembly protein TadD